MNRVDALVLIAYYAALGLLAIYSLHRLYLVRLRHRFDGGGQPPSSAVLTRWPRVTVQLPLFNERNVAARVIDAAAQLEYRGVFDIQVLDDSDDATTSIVAERVAFWSARGRHIAHVRRPARAGFKAGALAHGMTLSEAELFAVFDADFVPSNDVLTQMVPHFAIPDVGMVQARWGHLNRERSLLTRVQAIYLDGHFAIESAARHLGGRFFNFNGTAGMWRRSAIEDGGGWSAATLTEDLDLSYRAQLAGWRFVFLPDIVVPAELPSAISGFQQQQHRWAKGSIQTARKILPQILRSDLPAQTKTEAVFHLTNNSAYLLTVIVSLLVVPAIFIRQRLGIGWSVLLDFLLFAVSSGSVLFFYVDGQRRVGRSPALREMFAVLPIGIGISVHNAFAVIEGMLQRGGFFVRTPKAGDSGTPAIEQLPRIPIAEVLLAGFFTGAFGISIAAGQWASLPFLMLFLTGYSYIAGFCLAELLNYIKSNI
jgi:cellulose synthase/poly-beta-1,6-N-acetylglucosamine synthase-like glycosyltransferase